MMYISALTSIYILPATLTNMIVPTTNFSFQGISELIIVRIVMSSAPKVTFISAPSRFNHIVNMLL